jgi:hypothetical protein
MAFHTFDNDVPPLKIRCPPIPGSANKRRSVQHTQKSFSRITALMPDCWAAA